MKRSDLHKGMKVYHASDRDWEERGGYRSGAAWVVEPSARDDAQRYGRGHKYRAVTAEDSKGYRATAQVWLRNEQGAEWLAPLAHVKGEYEAVAAQVAEWRRQREVQEERHAAEKARLTASMTKLATALGKVAGKGVRTDVRWGTVHLELTEEAAQAILKALSMDGYAVPLDVHTEHCCAKHGCKYGQDPDCTVVLGLRPASFTDEACDDEARENMDRAYPTH